MDFNISKIMEMIPHRYPFLLIDRILSCENGQVCGLKNVSMNEPQFQGHFPDYPVMPGVLLVESIAQLSACGFCFENPEIVKHKKFYFLSIDSARFRQIVKPGDTLKIKANYEFKRNKIFQSRGEIFVEDKCVCSAAIRGTLISS